MGPSQASTETQMGQRPTLGWHIARVALAGSRRQAFLGHRSIGWLLRAAPERQRRSLALRILSLSPHYFIYQWERYPAGSSRRQVLEAESERNRRSRLQIAEQILAPMVSRDATVLDFGCGPGYLAGQVRQLAKEVVGVDVSSGTLACARVLNPGPLYRQIRNEDLPLADETIDLVYSIAVFQHIDFAKWSTYFDHFARVLRPGGQGVCHVVVADGEPVTYRQPAGLRRRYSLRFEESSSDDVIAALRGSGFVNVQVRPTDRGASIEDDVGRQHIATFCKPTGPRRMATT